MKRFLYSSRLIDHFLSKVFSLIRRTALDIPLGILAFVHVTAAIVSNYISKREDKKGRSKKQRILVIRIDHKLGDMVISSGFFRVLRSVYPDYLIDLVIHRSAVPLYEYCPYVDKIIAFDWGQSLPRSLISRVSRAKHFVDKNFPDEYFELIFVPRWDIDHHARFIAYFARGMRKIGYSRKVCSEKRIIEFGFDSLITENVVDNFHTHEAERSLHLISKAKGELIADRNNIKPELWLTVADRCYAEKEMTSWSSADAIALGPGAFMGKRKWPKERFVEVAEHYHAKGYSIILLGGDDDDEICDYISRNVGLHCISYAGKLTIRQSAALLEKCLLFIGNDSGLMHLAAAASVPCLEISCHPLKGDSSHANSPRRFGPLSLNSMICQPDNELKPCKDYCSAKEAHCILQVSVDQVIEKSAALLAS